MLYSIILAIAGFLVSCSTTQTPDSVLDTESNIDADVEQVSSLVELDLAIEEGNEITIELYKGDPERPDSTLLASTTVTYGEENLRNSLRELRKTTPDANYAVISANDSSRTIELRSKNHNFRGKRDSVLKNLEDGTVVELSLFSGDPENGGVLVTSSSFTVGEASFRDAFSALVDTAGNNNFDYLVITANGESQTRRLSSRNTDLRELLNGLIDGIEVNISLYDGDPATDGIEIINGSYIVGDGTFGATLRKLFREADSQASYFVVSAGDDSVTIEIRSWPKNFRIGFRK